MDHDLSPPWTLLNITKAIKTGLFAQPSECIARKVSAAYQMVNNRLTFQEQSWVPSAWKGAQLVIVPTARVDNHMESTIIEEHKLFFNPWVIALMFAWESDLWNIWVYIVQFD